MSPARQRLFPGIIFYTHQSWWHPNDNQLHHRVRIAKRPPSISSIGRISFYHQSYYSNHFPNGTVSDLLSGELLSFYHPHDTDTVTPDIEAIAFYRTFVPKIEIFSRNIVSVSVSVADSTGTGWQLIYVQHVLLSTLTIPIRAHIVWYSFLRRWWHRSSSDRICVGVYCGTFVQHWYQWSNCH